MSIHYQRQYQNFMIVPSISLLQFICMINWDFTCILKHHHRPRNRTFTDTIFRRSWKCCSSFLNHGPHNDVNVRHLSKTMTVTSVCNVSYTSPWTYISVRNNKRITSADSVSMHQKCFRGENNLLSLSRPVDDLSLWWPASQLHTVCHPSHTPLKWCALCSSRQPSATIGEV